MKVKSLFAVTLGIGLAMPSIAAAAYPRDRDEMKLEELPEAARAAVQQEVGDGTIREIERDKRFGKIVYEVEFVDKDGMEWEFDVSPEGKISDRHDD